MLLFNKNKYIYTLYIVLTSLRQIARNQPSHLVQPAVFISFRDKKRGYLSAPSFLDLTQYLESDVDPEVLLSNVIPREELYDSFPLPVWRFHFQYQ